MGGTSSSLLASCREVGKGQQSHLQGTHGRQLFGDSQHLRQPLYCCQAQKEPHSLHIRETAELLGLCWTSSWDWPRDPEGSHV